MPNATRARGALLLLLGLTALAEASVSSGLVFQSQLATTSADEAANSENSASGCWASVSVTTAFMQGQCLNKASCNVAPVPGSYPATSDPCPAIFGIEVVARLAFDYTCGNFLRSTFFHVHAIPGTTRQFWWSSGYGVYLSSASGTQTPETNLQRRITFGGFQPYSNFWIWQGRAYVTLANKGVYNILASTVSPPNGVVSNMVGFSGPFAAPATTDSIVASVHTDRASSTWGKIWVATRDKQIQTFISNDGISWTPQGTRTYEICFGSPCFSVIPSSVKYVQTQLLPTQRKIVFFGTNSGRLIYFDATDESGGLNSFSTAVAAAGSVYSIAHMWHDNTDYLYMGTSVNLIVQWDIQTSRITSIAFLSLAGNNLYAIDSLVADQSNGALFFGCGDGVQNAYVGRINVAGSRGTLEAFDTEPLPVLNTASGPYYHASVHAGALDVANNAIVFAGAQPVSTSLEWNQAPYFFKFSVASCSAYSCDRCGTPTNDVAYCSYCSGSDTCGRIPAIQGGQCAAQNLPLSRAACPTVLSLSKSVAATSGGTTVVFNGANFFSTQGTANYQCLFGGVAGTVVSVTSTAVTCLTPARGAGSINAELKFQGRSLPDPKPFSVVDCAAQTCSTCFAAGDCQWCYRAGGCRAANAAGCTGPSSTATCPVLRSVAPMASAVTKSIPITFRGDDLLASEKYRCRFGSYDSDAVYSASPVPSLTCQSPSGAGTIGAMVSPSILISTDPSNPVASFVPFTQSSVVSQYDLYDCKTIGACFPCINGHPECAFCRSTPGVTDGGCSYNITNSVDCSSGLTGTGTCPKITAAEPDVLHYIVDDGRNIQVTLTPAGAGSNPINLADIRCVWTSPTDVISPGVAPSIAPTSALGVICPGPPGGAPLTKGLWKLEIFVLTTPYSNGIRVNVYDCSAGYSCTTCNDPTERPQCNWCNSLLKCEAYAALPGGCPDTGSGCPVISVSPDFDTTAGGKVITITPNPVAIGQINATCRFDGLGINLDVEGAYQSDYTYTCTTPRAFVGGSASLSLYLNDILYANPIPFTYIDCSTVFDGIRNRPRNCSDCLLQSGCGWCGSECLAETQCEGSSLSTCPVITSISPNVTDALTTTTVVITTVPAPPAAFDYDCVFGTTVISASRTTNGVACQSPIIDIGGKLPLKINVRGAGAFTTDIVSPQVEFFKCSDTAASCGSSCLSSHCGYCADTGKCTGKDACLVNRPGALWISQDQGCPRLASVGPSYMQVALVNRTALREEISFKVDNLYLPSNVVLSPPVSAPVAAPVAGAPVADAPVDAPVAASVRRKRSILLSDFACVFGADVMPVDRFDDATSTFYCTAPVLFDQGFYSVYVTYKGNRLNSVDIQASSVTRFQVQDCYNIPACELCLLQPNCGWCRGSVRCMTKAWCDSEPITDWNTTCPMLASVSPATGYVTGAFEITIYGGPFVNSSEFTISLKFATLNEARILPATYVSQNQLMAFVPRRGDPGWENIPTDEVTLKLLIRDIPYIPSTLTFTFVELPNLVQGVSGGAIGGIVAALAVVIIALIVILVIMKRRKFGFFAQFRLKEPDYELIAFGTMMQPQWRVPKDRYDILAIKLLAKDHLFILALMQAVPPTEQDMIARSLTHFLEWHKKSVEFGVLFVTDEVKRNLEENTIFRNNSMASKWFKFYSKIVGIKYLFHVLARLIYELNKISELSAKAKEKGETDNLSLGSKSLLSIEMEVDPDKYGEDAFADSEANVYQLILACQKVFTSITRSINQIPKEFKQVFQSMRESIMNKFKSDPAILKAVGGFFFLRFVGPAITAPHAYGLLENPPNQTAQRQLVLIGKVMQNLANMTMPGTKEAFMQQLNDFFTRNIPKMVAFYRDLLSAHSEDQSDTEVVAVSDVTRDNALGFIWDFILTNETKVRNSFQKEADDDLEKLAAMEDTLKELKDTYPKKPKKFTAKDEPDK